MFEDGELGVDQLARLVAALPRVASSVDDAERIDKIRALEELTAAAAATQAQLAADFADSREQAQAAAGVRAAGVGTGVAEQVGLAKRESPHRARRFVRWARVLVTELPHTYAALRRGQTSQWRAMLVARETGWLCSQHRATVDAQLAGQLADLGDRAVQAEASRLAYRLDPHGAAARSSAAAADRRVTVRPAPDTMSRLTGFLPVAHGVAAYAALSRAADTLIGAGDTRSRGQIMADTLVERITGQASAEAVPVEVHLVMTDQTLLGTPPNTDPGRTDTGDDCEEPAHLHGYGPIPAPLARRLLTNPHPHSHTDAPTDVDTHTDADADIAEAAQVWVRRLYTHPDTGRLVAMETPRRCFDGALRRFLLLRDQTCRTPWCDAPIRHADHLTPAADGGTTSTANGQGLCAACNHTKQAPGWTTSPSPHDAGHTVTTTTPTGHSYPSRAPDPPGTRHPNPTAANPQSGTAPPAVRGPTDTPHTPEDRLRDLLRRAA